MLDKRKTGLLLVAIILVGLILRSVSIMYGLPHPGYFVSDEIDVVARTLSLAKGDLQPHHFSKPSFLNVLLLFVYGVGYLLYYVIGIINGAGDFERLFIQNPAIFYASARLASVVASTATLWVVYDIGSRLKDQMTGIIAAVLLCFCFMTVRMAHIAKEDSLFVFLVYTTLALVITAHRTDKPLYLIVSGIIAGLAAATKYNGLLALIFPLMFRIFCKEKSGLYQTIFLILFGFLFGFSLGNPYFIFHPVQFVRGVLESMIFRQIGGKTFWLGNESYTGLVFLAKMFLTEMGRIFPIFALISVVIVIQDLWKSRARHQSSFYATQQVIVMALLAFIALMFSVIMVSGHRDYHYILPVTPALALLTAYVLSKDSFRKYRALIVLLCILSPLYRSLKFDIETTGEDTRIIAARWIATTIPATEAIAFDTDFYYQYHPPIPLSPETIVRLKDRAQMKGGTGQYFSLMEKHRAPAAAYDAYYSPMPAWSDSLIPDEISHYSVEWLRAHGIQWMVCSSYYYKRVMNNRWEGLEPLREFYNRLEIDFGSEMIFEPRPWHNMGPTLRIYRLRNIELERL